MLKALVRRICDLWRRKPGVIWIWINKMDIFWLHAANPISLGLLEGMDLDHCVSQLRIDMGWFGATLAAAHVETTQCALSSASLFIWSQSGDWLLGS